MKTDIDGFEFELRELTLKDREILENECYKVVDGVPEIKSGSTKKFSIILGCKSAPFFKSVISDGLGITDRILKDREQEYYKIDKKYYPIINKLVVEINKLNTIDNDGAEDIAKK